MKKIVKIFLLSIYVILIASCQSVRPLNSYRKGNSFYIQNIDSEGNVVGIDNFAITNITFLQIDFTVFGINDINSAPKELYSGRVHMREKSVFDISKKLSENNDSLANYKYLCVQFPKGTLRKGRAYSEHNDVCIEIEQYGMEQNEIPNQIDENLFQELDRSFNQ